MRLGKSSGDACCLWLACCVAFTGLRISSPVGLDSQPYVVEASVSAITRGPLLTRTVRCRDHDLLSPGHIRSMTITLLLILTLSAATGMSAGDDLLYFNPVTTEPQLRYSVCSDSFVLSLMPKICGIHGFENILI